MGISNSPSFKRLHVMEDRSYASACAEGQNPAAPWRWFTLRQMPSFWSGGHFVHNEAFSIQSSCFFFTFSDAFQSGELSTQRPSRGSRSSVV